MEMTRKEKAMILEFLNENGYVLDFSTPEFSKFTIEHFDIDIIEEYKLSKFKSLKAFYDDNKNIQNKILYTFIDFYDYTLSFKDECSTDAYYNNRYVKFKKIEHILHRLKGLENRDILSIEIKKDLSTEYINSLINQMIQLQETNPTTAIGKAKELVETVCKTILERTNETIDKNDSLPKLFNKTRDKLKLNPKEIDDDIKLSNNLKGILQSLVSLTNNLAELRNEYGDGHGKSESYKGLQARHAKLAVGSASTLVNFLWDSFQLRKDDIKTNNMEEKNNEL